VVCGMWYVVREVHIRPDYFRPLFIKAQRHDGLYIPNTHIP